MTPHPRPTQQEAARVVAAWKQAQLDMDAEQQQAEWKRLSEIGWMNMSVSDLRDTVQAVRDLLVRDAQWAEKWKAALDLLDAPNERVRELKAERDMLRGAAGALEKAISWAEFTDEQLDELWALFPRVRVA